MSAPTTTSASELFLSLLPRPRGGGSGGLGFGRPSPSAVASATASAIPDGALLALAALAEATPALSAAFAAALDMIDAGAVTLVTAPSGSAAFLVTAASAGGGRRPGRGGDSALVLPGFCSCGSEREADDLCAHRLAAHLAAACGGFAMQRASDEDLAGILLRS